MSGLNDEELAQASAERLVELYRENKANQRRLIRKHFAERLKSSSQQGETLDLIRTLVDAGARDGDALRALLIRYDAIPREELRSLVVARGRYSMLQRLALFALVRGDDGSWLEEQLRAGALDEPQVACLVQAAVDDRAMEKRVIRLARDFDDGVLLANVLERFDVGRELTEKAVASAHPAARAAAMQHAHRLRDTRAALRNGLGDPETAVRRAALAALVERPDPQLRDEAAKLVDDPDQWDERYNANPVGDLARRFLKIVDSGD